MIRIFRKYFFLWFLAFGLTVLGPPGHAWSADINFHINQQLLTGKKILKVKRDFNDPFLWVLAEHNGVFRVNSLTMEVRDYSDVFRSFQGYEFIDIAGSSGERVFIATSSPLLLYLKDGSLKTITAADGLTDALSGIGICNFSYGVDAGDLYIGTTNGIASYNPETDAFLYYSHFTTQTDIKVFEATYRKLVAKRDNDPGGNPAYLPLVLYSYANYFGFAIYRYPESGSRINTAFYTFPAVLSEGGDFRSNIFWGNNDGMFQQAQTVNVFNHYLDHIPVNKITDIYSFITFGDPNQNTNTLTRENLLIGTAQGFYYSNSIYGNYSANDANNVTLEHFAPLGNLPVNDVCVNSTVSDALHIREGCENGVWLATDNGLVYLKPDFSGPAAAPNANVLAFAAQAPGLSSLAICGGASVDLVLDQNYVDNNEVQWFKDGVELTGKTGGKLTVSEGGTYRAILYNACANVHVSTNELKLNVIGSPRFTFDYPDVLNLCDLSATKLKISHQDDYQYRWLKDNIILNGENKDELTITGEGKYRAEISSCNGTWLSTREITVNLALPPPQISSVKDVFCATETAILKTDAVIQPGMRIRWLLNGQALTGDDDKVEISTVLAGNYQVRVENLAGGCSALSPVKALHFMPPPTFNFDAGDVTKCAGQSVVLRVTGDASYLYRWFRNGVQLDFQSAAISVGVPGKYKVAVSSCPGEWIDSKEVTVKFNQLPMVSILKDKPAYCSGSAATLSLNPFDTDGLNISWLVDGNPAPQYSGMTTIVTSGAGVYTVMLRDAAGCTVQSAELALAFDVPPVISIEQNGQAVLCEGGSMILHAVHSPGTVRWSTGQTGDDIVVSTSGDYQAYITAAGGCEEFAETTVTVHPVPLLAVADASICEFNGESVTLDAPAGLKSYEWNGVPGGSTFTVKKSGQVVLHVTGQNGCEASETIQVNARCADIHIPNTFTPNGDGSNDQWVISGLDGDQSLKVQVFNRYGNAVFEHLGTPAPWDGRKNGARLPAGVYYYLIKAKGGHSVLSGSLTLVY